MAENLQMPSDQEAELLKTVFKDNEGLLKLMRKLWFGLELTQDEKGLIKGTFQGVTLREAVRKKIFSQMGDDAPIGSVPDFWLNVSDTQLIGMNKETIYQIVTYRGKVLKMFQTAIALLENPDGEKVDISFSPLFNGGDEMQTGLLARNTYVRAMETSLHLINQIANLKVEKPEEAKKKLAKNSSK